MDGRVWPLGGMWVEWLVVRIRQGLVGLEKDCCYWEGVGFNQCMDLYVIVYTSFRDFRLMTFINSSRLSLFIFPFFKSISDPSRGH